MRGLSSMRARLSNKKAAISAGKRPSGGLCRGLWNLVGPHLEALQRVRPERLGDRHVGGVASLRNQHAADPRLVVARIESVPAAAEIGLEPAGEIADRPRLRRADVAEIAGAIARRNVHAAAEGDRQMRIVAAHALALIVDL